MPLSSFFLILLVIFFIFSYIGIKYEYGELLFEEQIVKVAIISAIITGLAALFFILPIYLTFQIM
jgi:hypothetical protein